MSGDIDQALFEGLFCRALNVSGALEEELRALGFDRRKQTPRYSGAVFVKCLDAACRSTLPTVELGAAQRQLGLRFVEGFRQTVLGKVVTTALPLLGPARFVRQLPGRFAAIRSDATVQIDSVTATGARLDFIDPLPLGHFFQGVLEGALRFARVKGQVALIQISTGYALELSW